MEAKLYHEGFSNFTKRMDGYKPGNRAEFSLPFRLANRGLWVLCVFSVDLRTRGGKNERELKWPMELICYSYLSFWTGTGLARVY